MRLIVLLAVASAAHPESIGKSPSHVAHAAKERLACFEETDAEQAAAFAKADFLDAQAFEIDFHMRNKWRQSSAFLQSPNGSFEAGALRSTRFQARW